MRIPYEGREEGREKLEEETGEERQDDEERQEPMLRKWKYDKYLSSTRTFSNFSLLGSLKKAMLEMCTG